MVTATISEVRNHVPGIGLMPRKGSRCRPSAPCGRAKIEVDAEGLGAHTETRHGPDVTLAREPGTPTIEGRIYGDDPWQHPENRSYRWTDSSTMNRTINEYVRQNWETIRHDLAFDGRHRGGFDAGHRVGEGYVNTGMFGAGPRASQYTVTSLMKIRIQLVPGSDPPTPFVVTAFPSGLL